MVVPALMTFALSKWRQYQMHDRRVKMTVHSMNFWISFCYFHSKQNPIKEIKPKLKLYGIGCDAISKRE